MRSDSLTKGGEGLKVVYIEDRRQDAENYKSILSLGGKMEVTTIFPAPDLEIGPIVSEHPDLVLIDYELSRKLPSGQMVPYQGGTLATKLREELPDYPLILFTRRKIIEKYSPEEELGAIDDIVYKEVLERNPHAYIRMLAGYANGFATLRRVSPKTWNGLLTILGATSSEADLLREASPPFELRKNKRPKGKRKGGKRIEDSTVWSVRKAAEWILRTLFAYPGILYDSLYASASLGIDEKSFLKKETQDHFKSAKFVGPFLEVEQRWWRGRLHEEAFQYLRKARLRPVLPESFPEAFRKVTGASLRPSKCVFSGEPFAESVCYVLRQPVKREYTLEYFPDNRPLVMDVARVSFKAIREDNRVQEELFKSSSRRLLDKIPAKR
jgi:DNA-binding NarL/FixJ family response regulator